MTPKTTYYEETYSDKISGTEVNYYLICKRRCWLCRHNVMITMGNPHIIRGRILDERSRRGHEEIRVGRNKIDVTTNKKERLEVHEYKKGKKTRESAKYQLLHYLRCLKEYGIEGDGFLHNLKSKTKKQISLKPQNERRLKKIYESIIAIDKEQIPELVENDICHTGCSFEEYCWG